jgi:hypothetical protein
MVWQDIPSVGEVPHKESSPVLGLMLSERAEVMKAAGYEIADAQQAQASNEIKKSCHWRQLLLLFVIFRCKVERRWSKAQRGFQGRKDIRAFENQKPIFANTNKCPSALLLI